jgi:hypothetical protein
MDRNGYGGYSRLRALRKPVQTTNGALQCVPGKGPSVTVFRGVPYTPENDSNEILTP